MDRIVTEDRLRRILKSRFKGVISRGKHMDWDDKCCPMELLSVAKETGWTDMPEDVRAFDFRDISDIKVPDELRTDCLLPIVAAYNEALDWDLSVQEQVAEEIALQTVKRILPLAKGLSKSNTEKLEAVESYQEALDLVSFIIRTGGLKKQSKTPRLARGTGINTALSWAYAALSQKGADSACASSKMAEAVAYMGDAQDREYIFRTACLIWLEAVTPAEFYQAETTDVKREV